MIFPYLTMEQKVQLGDKTRFDASRSFTSGAGETEFLALRIQPGLGENLINAFDDNPADRVLDWVFNAFQIDIDATNNKIDFSEDNGTTTLTATITAGSYDKSDLALEIKTQLEISGALTYTVAFNVDEKLTISSTAAFNIISDGPSRNVNLISELYFDLDDLHGKDTYTSARVESLKRKVTVIAGQNVYGQQTVKTLINTLDALNNKYFFIYSAKDETLYYVWFNSNSLGTDPLLSGTAVPVALATSDTAAQVATKLAIALDGLADFSASATTDTVTVISSNYGYSTSAYDGNSAFTFALTLEGQEQASEHDYVQVYTEEGDALFSSDSDLTEEESDILRFLPPGKAAFKYAHRQSQKKIMEQLDRQGFTDVFEQKLTKWAVKDVSEVNEWSRYMALRMIYEDASNAKDDSHKGKASYYSAQEIMARKHALLRLDVDGDGIANQFGEGVDTATVRLAFR